MDLQTYVCGREEKSVSRERESLKEEGERKRKKRVDLLSFFLGVFFVWVLPTLIWTILGV